MKKLIPFLIIFIVVLILYHPVLTTYFSQDDFFHFKVNQTDGNVVGFINLFGFHPFKHWGGTSKQASIILNNSDAIQLLYKDPIIRVYYEDLGTPPNEITSIYWITAKIN